MAKAKGSLTGRAVKALTGTHATRKVHHKDGATRTAKTKAPLQTKAGFLTSFGHPKKSTKSKTIPGWDDASKATRAGKKPMTATQRKKAIANNRKRTQK